MIIDLRELNNKKEVSFKFKVEKDENLDRRILDLKEAYVVGKVYNDSSNNIILDCTFSGIMYIKDSISLDIVPYNFDFSISESLDYLIDNYENCYDNNQITLDLKQILWQNIVLEVPISYSLVKDAKIKGKGWELVNEEKMGREIDPRLKKLEELLERRD